MGTERATGKRDRKNKEAGVRNSVYIRAATRELLRGQLLLGFSDHETHAIITWQKVIEVAIDGQFGMLFPLFTRLNSAFNDFKGKNTVEQSKRSERVARDLLLSIDKWPAWEKTRRARYSLKLKREK